MLGRLLSATVLLGGTLAFTAPGKGNFTDFTPLLLLGLIVSTYAASLAFAVWLPRAHSLTRVAAVQVGLDLIWVTALVYVSGGVASVFTFLYGVVILMTALIVGPRESQRVAVVAVVGHTVLGVSVAVGWIPWPPDQPPERYLLELEAIGFPLVSNVVGLTLVAALASTLAERLQRAGGELRVAAESASRLARLNDDIVRSISSGVLTVGPDGLVLASNPAAAAIFGDEDEGLSGRAVTDLLPVSKTPARSRGEGRGRRPDGSSFPAGWNSSPLVDENGATTGMLYSFQDLTEIVELRETAQKAERLATLGGLAAGLAHEIRNPLSSISGSVQLVREAEALEDEDRKLLGIVLAEVERLEDLVTTMLSVGRPRPPMRARHDLVEIARGVISMAEQGPGAKRKVTIDFETTEGAVLANVDSDQVRQVIWNLLKNALQATEAGGRVSLSVEPDADGNGMVIIEDEGRGIPEEQRERLFDTFYSGRTHGVGLGLALVKQIVDAHGATIEVESEPNEGSTFRVTFLAEADRDDA